MKAIYILEAEVKHDFGFVGRWQYEYAFYFTDYREAENHIPIFQDKVERQFKMKWKMDEDSIIDLIEVIIKEKQPSEVENKDYENF